VSDIAAILKELADLKRIMANTIRHGQVHEAQGGKVRIVVGVNPDGSPMLTPWLHTGDSHNGEIREEKRYKKGQNVTVFAMGGNLAHATVLPYAFNSQNPRPDDADQAPHTYQQGELKMRRDERGQVLEHTKTKQVVGVDGVLQQVAEAVHQVVENRVRSAIGSSSVNVLKAGVRALARRIDLN